MAIPSRQGPEGRRMRLLQIMALANLMTFATVAPGFCKTKFMDASQLLKICTANKNDPAHYEYEAACTAYVIGVPALPQHIEHVDP